MVILLTFYIIAGYNVDDDDNFADRVERDSPPSSRRPLALV